MEDLPNDCIAVVFSFLDYVSGTCFAQVNRSIYALSQIHPGIVQVLSRRRSELDLPCGIFSKLGDACENWDRKLTIDRTGLSYYKIRISMSARKTRDACHYYDNYTFFAEIATQIPIVRFLSSPCRLALEIPPDCTIGFMGTTTAGGFVQIGGRIDERLPMCLHLLLNLVKDGIDTQDSSSSITDWLGPTIDSQPRIDVQFEFDPSIDSSSSVMFTQLEKFFGEDINKSTGDYSETSDRFKSPLTRTHRFRRLQDSNSEDLSSLFLRCLDFYHPEKLAFAGPGPSLNDELASLLRDSDRTPTGRCLQQQKKKGTRDRIGDVVNDEGLSFFDEEELKMADFGWGWMMDEEDRSPRMVLLSPTDLSICGSSNRIYLGSRPGSIKITAVGTQTVVFEEEDQLTSLAVGICSSVDAVESPATIGLVEFGGVGGGNCRISKAISVDPSIWPPSLPLNLFAGPKGTVFHGTLSGLNCVRLDGDAYDAVNLEYFVEDVSVRLHSWTAVYLSELGAAVGASDGFPYQIVGWDLESQSVVRTIPSHDVIGRLSPMPQHSNSCFLSIDACRVCLWDWRGEIRTEPAAQFKSYFRVFSPMILFAVDNLVATCLRCGNKCSVFDIRRMDKSVFDLTTHSEGSIGCIQMVFGVSSEDDVRCLSQVGGKKMPSLSVWSMKREKLHAYRRLDGAERCEIDLFRRGYS